MKTKYFKTTEAAKLLHISKQTLINWDNKGIVKPHHKTPTGIRFYSQEQIDSLLNVSTNTVEEGE